MDVASKMGETYVQAARATNSMYAALACSSLPQFVSPLGEVLAGPLEGGEGLVTAEIDLNDIVRGKFDLDVAGHYARPDVFRLTVDTAAKPAVSMENGEWPVVGAGSFAE